jgi:uncharacterized protein
LASGSLLQTPESRLERINNCDAEELARSRSAARLTKEDEDAATHPPPILLSVLAGAGIGFVAGVTGIGGGILLAPLMLGVGWSGIRQTAAASAAFNLLNSAAALFGLWINHPSFPLPSLSWLAAVACGGLLGSWLGVRGLPTWVLRYALAALVLIAGGRMLRS